MGKNFKELLIGMFGEQKQNKLLYQLLTCLLLLIFLLSRTFFLIIFSLLIPLTIGLIMVIYNLFFKAGTNVHYLTSLLTFNNILIMMLLAFLLTIVFNFYENRLLSKYLGVKVKNIILEKSYPILGLLYLSLTTVSYLLDWPAILGSDLNHLLGIFSTVIVPMLLGQITWNMKTQINGL